AFFRTDLRDQAEAHALELSRQADSPRALQELPPNWKISPASLLVMIDSGEEPGALGRRARRNIERNVYREGQFDMRSESAGPSPASEMTPRVAVPSSSTSRASSKDDCHAPFTIVAASAGKEIATPGGSPLLQGEQWRCRLLV